MTGSKVSVLIPAYNHEDYVEDTLRSIADQDYPNIEIVVIDDCSPDGTVAAIERFIESSPAKVVFRRNELNKGAVPNLNQALHLATGDYIVLFASDDLFVPGRLSRQVSFMEAHPDVRILFGNGLMELPENTRRPLHNESVRQLLDSSPQEVLRYLYTHKSPLFLQTAMIRRDFIVDLGGYDEGSIADDWLMNCKVFAALDSRNQFAYLDEPFAIYKVHGENVHLDFDRQSRGKLQFVKRYTPKELRREALANIHTDIAQLAVRRGMKGRARFHALKALLAGRKRSNYKLLRSTLRRS